MAQPLTIARPYAKAIFELAKGDDKSRQQWSAFLSCLSELTANHNVLHNLNQSGFLAEMETWMNEWLDKNRGLSLTKEETNTLHLLDSHGRLVVAPQILDEFIRLCSLSQNTVIVQVKSAKPLNEQTQTSLKDTLAQKIGKDVVLEVEEDGSLMAGVVIEYDGQVIDQSMKGRLTQFARKLDD